MTVGREAHDSRLVIFVVVSMAWLMVGCMSGSGPAGTTAPSTPTPIATPAAPAAPQPTPTIGSLSSPTATGATYFGPIDGFTFQPMDPQVLQDFESAVTASMGDSGSIGDVRAADAFRGDEPAVTVIAFSLRPTDGAEEQMLFGLLTDSMAAGLGATWQTALEGQALSMETPEQTVIILPWATRADGTIVFLFVSGGSDAPVEDVARGLAE